MVKRMEMTPRERIKKAIEHKEVNRVPIDLGATPVTGIAVSVVARLRQVLGLDSKSKSVRVIEPYQMLGEIAEDIRKILRVDTIGLWGRKNLFGFENKNWKPWRLFDGTDVLVPGAFNTEPDENGDILMYPEGDKNALPSGRMPKGGFYFDAIIRQPPINKNALDPEDNLEEFNLINEEDLKYFQDTARDLYNNTDYAIVANFGGTSFGDIALVPAPFLKYPKGIRDIEEWYVSTITRKGYILEVFERQCEIALKNMELIRQAVQDKISVIFVSGTDFGTQSGPFISKDLYCELYKPFHKKLNDWIHRKTEWKTFIHSCGGVEPLIEEFIDAGFDILNPVQCSAVGMNQMVLKEKYGRRITFWGGGVNTQNTLPFGNTDDVYREVKERIKIFANGGGFVFNPIHNIQSGTPVENVLAMLKAVWDSGSYIEKDAS